MTVENFDLAVVTRLRDITLHPVNVSPELLAYTRTVAQDAGITHTLLLTILWQEQQWTQNGHGFLGAAERKLWDIAEFGASQTVDPTISLGITHMKLPTARTVAVRFGLTAHGVALTSLSDRELARLIAQDERTDILLAAHYLRYLHEERMSGEPDEWGADTDEDLFILYAADTPQVRNYNALYGSSVVQRSGDIAPRMRDYSAFNQWLADAQRWEGLTLAERASAALQFASTMPKGEKITLRFPYPVDESVQTSIVGTMVSD